MDGPDAAPLGGKSGAMLPPARDGPPRPPEANGAAERLSAKSDASLAAAEPSRAPPGKLKKTAFKFFGGKRSICTLPSFFGGKSRGPGKGASKKGLSKSRTHDGISDVGYEEGGPGPLPSPLESRAGFPSSQLPTSQSALLGTEAGLRGGPPWPPASLSGSSEGLEKKPGGGVGDKSSFPSRPKKGLRGFFNSIRRHRKSKNPEPERTELQDWTARGGMAGEPAQAGGAESSRASKEGARESPALSPEGGETLESRGAGAPGDSRDELGAVDGSGPCGEAARVAVADEGSPEAEVSPDSALCDLSASGDPLDPLEGEDPDRGPPGGVAAPGDQLSLLFGDVASLQSFDSLTGCGDIIAEPDMDSLVEGSGSAGRGKEGAKRNSCLVTYQGGGEEMALPEEVEDYLQQVWEGPAQQGEPAYEAGGADREPPGANGAETEARFYDDIAGGEADLSTPRSEQQESAPNSDEGYYDSATPGPEEEAGEGLLEEAKKERLPRDSYSGDALYEFYESDEALMSPSGGGEDPWFERKGSPPAEILGCFFDFSLPGKKDLIRRLAQKREGTETEEERLAAIQTQLLFWEMQREPALKHLERLSQDWPLREKPPGEGRARAGSFVSKAPGGLGYEEVAPRGQNSGHDWRDLHEMLLAGGCLAPFSENRSAPDAEAGQTPLEPCALVGSAVEESGPYPFYRTHGGPGSPAGEPRNRAGLDFGDPRPGSGCEPEQAVNFSQALVAFTSSGTLFSSLSESLGSSDSGSAFAQSLPGLPTMVTFDIVDVEREGEGECEQRPEMAADEDMGASFEAFGEGEGEESYLPKESFVGREERLYAGDPWGSFRGCNWGIASLPRCLRLQELSPPGPELLSLCRRSRSLDTESLELELAASQPPGSGFKPRELWSPRGGGPKKGPGSPQRSAPCSPEGKGGAAGDLSWPGLQEAPSGKGPSSPKPQNGDRGPPPFPSPWSALGQLDAEAPLGSPDCEEVPPRGPLAGGVDRPGLPGTKPTPRPSNLPLQNPLMAREGCGSHRADGDREAEVPAWASPSGGEEAGLPAWCKPTGLGARNVSAVQQGGRSPS